MAINKRRMMYERSRRLEVELRIHEEATEIQKVCGSPDYVCRNVVRWRQADSARRIERASKDGSHAGK